MCLTATCDVDAMMDVIEDDAGINLTLRGMCDMVTCDGDEAMGVIEDGVREKVTLRGDTCDAAVMTRMV